MLASVGVMVSCPACSRPNGEDRRLCLYCGAVLADPSRIARETASALFPVRDRNLSGHVVAVVPGQDADALATGAAPAFGCQPFMAAQILRRPFPPVSRFENASEAAAFEGALQRAGVAYVSFAEAELNDVPEPAVAHHVRIQGATLELAVDAATSTCAIADLAYVVVGQIEIHKTKHVREVKTQGDRDGQVRQVVTSTQSRDFDAFTVFDLYGGGGLSLSRPARLVETACTIDGAGFVGASRGGGFARFAKWLKAQRPELIVDDRYRQLGKHHRRKEIEPSGRELASGPFQSREVLATESQLSGQGFDLFSSLAWTLWRLTNETPAG